MNGIPIIKFEIERIRETICSMLTDRNDELNGLIVESINKTITEDWVVSKINQGVKDCIEKAISQISDNYQLQSAIHLAIVDVLVKKIEGQE